MHGTIKCHPALSTQCSVLRAPSPEALLTSDHPPSIHSDSIHPASDICPSQSYPPQSPQAKAHDPRAGPGVHHTLPTPTVLTQLRTQRRHRSPSTIHSPRTKREARPEKPDHKTRSPEAQRQTRVPESPAFSVRIHYVVLQLFARAAPFDAQASGPTGLGERVPALPPLQLASVHVQCYEVVAGYL